MQTYLVGGDTIGKLFLIKWYSNLESKALLSIPVMMGVGGGRWRRIYSGEQRLCEDSDYGKIHFPFLEVREGQYDEFRERDETI